MGPWKSRGSITSAPPDFLDRTRIEKGWSCGKRSAWTGGSGQLVADSALHRQMEKAHHFDRHSRRLAASKHVDPVLSLLLRTRRRLSTLVLVTAGLAEPLNAKADVDLLVRSEEGIHPDGVRAVGELALVAVLDAHGLEEAD